MAEKKADLKANKKVSKAKKTNKPVVDNSTNTVETTNTVQVKNENSVVSVKENNTAQKPQAAVANQTEVKNTTPSVSPKPKKKGFLFKLVDGIIYFIVSFFTYLFFGFKGIFSTLWKYIPRQAASKQICKVSLVSKSLLDGLVLASIAIHMN